MAAGATCPPAQQGITEEVARIPLRLENFTAMANTRGEIDLRTVYSHVKTAKMSSSCTSVQFEMLK